MDLQEIRWRGAQIILSYCLP